MSVTLVYSIASRPQQTYNVMYLIHIVFVYACNTSFIHAERWNKIVLLLTEL